MINNIHVISPAGDDIRQEEISKRLIDIDYECFEGIDLADEGTIEYWLKNRMSSYVELLLADDKIVGYLDFLAINNLGAKKLESGDWRDGEIDSNLLANINDSEVSLYLVSVAIQKEYRGQGFANLLWNYARKRFINSDFQIKNIYAIVWTESGWGVLKSLNPTIIAHDYSDHPVVVIKSKNGTIPEKLIISNNQINE